MPLHNGSINQILPFATGVAKPNVLELEAYTADPARLGGNASGLARSAFMNRTWRQSAHVAAGVAQYIANRYPPGVRDDGNLDAVELGMATAIGASMRWNATITYSVPALVFGTNGKLYTALAPSGPDVASVGPKNPVDAGSVGFWLDYVASITPPVDNFRTELIGSPMYYPSTILKTGFMWADGSLALFADWPELAVKYNAGGFNGMVDNSSNGANLGKFVLHSNGTGLYLPRLGGQFMRNWGPGSGTAGAWGRDEIRNIIGQVNSYAPNFGILRTDGSVSDAFSFGADTVCAPGGGNTAMRGRGLTFNAASCVPTGSENVPAHIRQPIVIYMGTHA